VGAGAAEIMRGRRELLILNESRPCHFQREAETIFLRFSGSGGKENRELCPCSLRGSK